MRRRYSFHWNLHFAPVAAPFWSRVGVLRLLRFSQNCAERNLLAIWLGTCKLTSCTGAMSKGDLVQVQEYCALHLLDPPAQDPRILAEGGVDARKKRVARMDQARASPTCQRQGRVNFIGGGIDLTQEHFVCLQAGCDLNDTVMNFVFGVLQQQNNDDCARMTPGKRSHLILTTYFYEKLAEQGRCAGLVTPHPASKHGASLRFPDCRTAQHRLRESSS